MQIDDSDIGPILLWKEVQDSRPNWEQITAGSPALKNYWSQWDRLLLKGGVLYRKFETDAGDSELHQLVVPKEIQEEILDKSHNHRLSGHFMAKKTLKRIRELYYWSGYRGHVEKWCKSCDACASRKGPRKKANASLKQYGAGHVLQRCAMDIMGPLPVSSRGNRYVVVIADYFTKWTEAFAIADMEAETVARVLVEEFICRFGVPEELHTDQGRQFESELFQHMCRLLDIHKTRTTPFHPQSDGMVERFNRTLEDMLSLVVSENQKDWDAWLPYLLMAYRSAEHESTGFSPAEIMLGRMVTLPLSAQLPRLPDETDSPRKPTPKYVLELDKTMHRIHEIARGKLKLASDKQKKFHDKGAYNQEFTQGDLIWLLNTKRKRGISPKLQKRWDGPGKILKKLSDVIYRVKMRPKKKPQVVHHNRLKPYIGEDPPLWLLRKPSISEAPQQTVTEVENLQKQ
ncbi:Retrovirus-related Pol polyprotein from transposon [Apostichopus japonicus]|nr:Retrovirus-related Pol polyprotein from transposon [Apostichopus japonicus]